MYLVYLLYLVNLVSYCNLCIWCTWCNLSTWPLSRSSPTAGGDCYRGLQSSQDLLDSTSPLMATGILTPYFLSSFLLPPNLQTFSLLTPERLQDLVLVIQGGSRHQKFGFDPGPKSICLVKKQNKNIPQVCRIIRFKIRFKCTWYLSVFPKR